MDDPSLAQLLNDLSQLSRLDRLPDLALLLAGVLVGLVARNLYALLKNLFGFAGSFFGRMFVGWWQDLRRETPNIIDVAMMVPVTAGGRQLLLIDGLVGATRLTDLYLNPRTAFGVRIQAFFLKPDKPWLHYPVPRETVIGRRIRLWRNVRRRRAGLAAVTPETVRQIKYRRIYQPLESLVGQFLTNDWATAATLGEPVYLFRFVIVVVYEKDRDDYIDRQFHALVIWDHVLEDLARGDELTAVQPEFRQRPATLARIAKAWRAAGADAAWQFGTLYVTVPRALLTGTYVATPVVSPSGAVFPVHRPAGSLDPADAAVILSRGPLLPPGA
jgi:hypothetical protein